MFGMYRDILGQIKVQSAASGDRLINLAVKSQDGNTVWVYLINKNLEKPEVEVLLSLDNYKAKDYSAVGFDSTDGAEGALEINEVMLKKRGESQYSLSVPQFSFVKITFTK
ncbi:hypothetical protein BH24BAC1_BH24BAC1_19090 [soil metagenome]